MEFFNTDHLESDEIKLVLERTKEADPSRNRVPAYCFLIRDRQNNTVGYCDLKIGSADSLYYSGHIGYGVDEKYRGHHYAAKACRLLFGLAKKHGMDHLFISCVPTNAASSRTCVIAGGTYIETAAVPEDNELYADGKRQVMVYRFEL